MYSVGVASTGLMNQCECRVSSPAATSTRGTSRGTMALIEKHRCQFCKRSFIFKRFPCTKANQGHFCSRSCAQSFRTGEKNSKWRGGRIRERSGRVKVYAPGHPDARHYGGTHIYEYRLVAAQMLGRPLKKHEIVHHINNDPTDNRPENLVVMTQAEHAVLHGTKNRRCWCGRKHEAHGLCTKHYQQMKRES